MSAAASKEAPSTASVFVYRSSGTAQFDAGGFEVQVRPKCDSPADGARELAEKLFDHALAIAAAEVREAAWKRACEAHEARIRELESVIVGLRARMPESPKRLMGKGAVRFAGGRLWLMNRREGGWRSSGILVGDWDELFRRFNVRVTDHGEDDSGLWWDVENAGGATRATP